MFTCAYTSRSTSVWDRYRWRASVTMCNRDVHVCIHIHRVCWTVWFSTPAATGGDMGCNRYREIWATSHCKCVDSAACQWLCWHRSLWATLAVVSGSHCTLVTYMWLHSPALSMFHVCNIEELWGPELNYSQAVAYLVSMWGSRTVLASLSEFSTFCEKVLTSLPKVVTHILSTW